MITARPIAPRHRAGKALVAGALAVLLVTGGGARAQEAGAPAADAPEAAGAAAQRSSRPRPPQAFASPEAGFAALAEAARVRDAGRLIRVLGDEARRLVSSGDPVADRAALERFAAAHAAKSEILRPAPDRAVLQVGEDGWPLPIPIRRGSDGRWRFDAGAGAQELLVRRIGRNELAAIGTLRAIVDAQRHYALTAGRQGPFRTYARRLFSSPGTRDGLYWPTAEGEPESPLGPLVAAASAGGYGGRAPADQPQPFHGYLFRILERQGPAAPGGALDYVVSGRMIGGFAVLAWPARHGDSGVMTFLADHQGEVRERDLGPDTARLARGITAFDPGPAWRPVAE
ncbi:DUF2950 domain-containing protein [Belnapia sp. T6]|uniref:DUF2950 domain-containing protein n=1 Tax=Belnapia mucosa TaxID=2804532 RepID=A0ABS1VBU2_9PROT|nr:DUF2950 domain-containing protein [Belnapia mucosa]MBL6459150.1 DUF2950 domain-containing protein [Belnapia mucosa]